MQVIAPAVATTGVAVPTPGDRRLVRFESDAGVGGEGCSSYSGDRRLKAHRIDVHGNRDFGCSSYSG